MGIESKLGHRKNMLLRIPSGLIEAPDFGPDNDLKQGPGRIVVRGTGRFDLPDPLHCL